jgi:hypothetical protein
MALRFAYGSYATPICTTRPTSRSIVPRIINEFAVSYIWTLSFDIEITGDTTAEIIAATIALRQAISVQGLSGGLQFGSDTDGWFNTDHWLNAFGAIGGVLVTQQGLSDSPLQLATEQRCTLTMTAEYANASETRTLLEFAETVEISGEGGADTELAEQATLPGFYQEITKYTRVTVTQSGRLVGKTNFPGLPAPLITIAGARKVTATRDKKSYETKGLAVIKFIREYSYTFVLATHPGTVNPNLLT